jgi:hypothetical protein
MFDPARPACLGLPNVAAIGGQHQQAWIPASLS